MSAQRGKEPPSYEDIMESIYLQASDLLNAGQTPRVLEVGIRQRDVLKARGVTSTLVIGAGRDVGDQSLFRRPGEPYGRTEIERVELRIERVDRDDWLQVTTGQQS
jgi:hypothetical protein